MARITGLVAFAAFLAATACSKAAPVAADTPKPAPVAAAEPAPEPAPPVVAAPATPPPPITDPLNIGSQDARDQLYCSAVIFARYSSNGEALSPTEEAVRMRNEGFGMIIAQAGADKLMAEGVARVTQIGAISDAYADQVAKDIKAKKTRLKLDDCMKRAQALPMPQ